ncbi:hypothetical protein D3C83_210450 [compost metagenome]
MKSTAAAPKDMAISRPLAPLRMMMGTSARAGLFWSLVRTVQPSMPGIMMSRMMRLGIIWAARSRPCWPEPAVKTS